MLPVTLDPDVDLFSRDDAAREAAWQRAIGSRLPGHPHPRRHPWHAGRPSPSTRQCSGPTAGSGQSGPGQTPTGTATSGSQGTTPPRPASTGTPAPGDATSGTATGQPSPPSTTPAPSTSGQPDQPSPAAEAIARLGDELVTQLKGRSVWALPYADADLAATVGIDPANSLVRDLVTRAATLAQRLDQPARSDIVWPVDGLLPAGREQGIKTLLSGTPVKKPAGIVVSAPAVTKPPAYTPTARRVTAGGTRLLAYDTRLSALLPKRTDPSPVLSVQRYLAESLVLLGERAGTPRSVLVVAPTHLRPRRGRPRDLPRRDVERAVARDGRRGLAAHRQRQRQGGAPDATDRTPSPRPRRRPVLNARRLTLMADQRDTLLSVSSVLRDGEEFERTYREVLDELASARWR